MTDMKTCRVCDEEFDWCLQGFISIREDKELFVCGRDCAEKSATEGGFEEAVIWEEVRG